MANRYQFFRLFHNQDFLPVQQPKLVVLVNEVVLWMIRLNIRDVRLNIALLIPIFNSGRFIFPRSFRPRIQVENSENKQT